jgi:hypothetical protein
VSCSRHLRPLALCADCAAHEEAAQLRAMGRFAEPELELLLGAVAALGIVQRNAAQLRAIGIAPACYEPAWTPAELREVKRRLYAQLEGAN